MNENRQHVCLWIAHQENIKVKGWSYKEAEGAGIKEEFDFYQIRELDPKRKRGNSDCFPRKKGPHDIDIKSAPHRRQEHHVLGKGEHAQQNVRLKRAARYAQQQHQSRRNSGTTSAGTKLSVLFSFYVVYFYKHEQLIFL